MTLRGNNFKVDNTMYRRRPLTFIPRSGYLNFSPQFMKNVLFEPKKTKLLNKHSFVENKTGIMQNVFKVQ